MGKTSNQISQCNPSTLNGQHDDGDVFRHSGHGGLNEQMFDVFAFSGGTDALNKALADVMHGVHEARKDG